jgi:hypothetical protein
VISGGNSPLALGSVNTSTIASANSEGLGSLSPYTFGEASIAFSALFGTSTCGKFGSVYLKSRSSDSFTSEIKDFIGPQHVSISNCATLTTDSTDSATIGNPISDTATLSGATPTATGTMTFKLYGPFTGSDPTADTCVDGAGGNLVTTLTVNSIGTPNASGDFVVGSGDYSPTAIGRYQWRAFYSGDGSNSSASTACGDANEASLITKIDSTISTAQNLVPNDSATIGGGGTLNGTATFKLFLPDNPTCASGANDSAPVSLTGTTAVGVSGSSPQTVSTNNTATTDTLAGSHASALGTWHWLVTYTGDTTHNDSTSDCIEAFTIDDDVTN